MHVTKDGKLYERARINSGGDMTLLNDKGVPVILLSTSLGGTVAVQKDLIAGGSLTVTGTQARPALLGSWDTFQGSSQTRMRHAAC